MSAINLNCCSICASESGDDGDNNTGLRELSPANPSTPRPHMDSGIESDCSSCSCSSGGVKNVMLPAATDFKILKLLGKGAFANVYLSEHLPTGDFVALKVMRKLVTSPTQAGRKGCDKKKQQPQEADPNVSPPPPPPPPPSAKVYTDAVRELEILRKITRHKPPGVVNLLGAFNSAHHVCVVLTWGQGGELWNCLSKEGFLLEPQARFYLAEIVLSLRALHELGIIYRDLKLENVLLDKNGHALLADFGLSKMSCSKRPLRAMSFLGTPNYIAPEVFKRVEYDESVDWWGLGVLMYYMLTGSLPFNGKTEKDISKAVMKRKLNYPKHISDSARGLITKLLVREPGSRLKFEGIQKHAFFKQVNWKSIRSSKPPFRPDMKKVNNEVVRLRRRDNRSTRPTTDTFMADLKVDESQCMIEAQQAFSRFFWAREGGGGTCPFNVCTTPYAMD